MKRPAGTAPSLEKDVLPETSNMLMTAVLDTSVAKRVWVVSAESVRRDPPLQLQLITIFLRKLSQKTSVCCSN